MDQKPEESKTDTGKSEFDTHAAANLAAYPLSGWAGYYAAKQHIRNSSVEYHTKLGSFDDATIKMQQKAAEVKLNGGKPHGTIQQAMAKIREEYEEAKSDRFNEMGYKGIKHNYMDLADNSKTEAAVVFVTVSSLVLAAALTALNSKDIFKPLFHKPESKDKGVA